MTVLAHTGARRALGAWCALAVIGAACASRGAAGPDMSPCASIRWRMPFPEIMACRWTSPMPAARAGLVRLVDSLTQDTTFRMAHWGILIMDPEVGDTIVSRGMRTSCSCRPPTRSWSPEPRRSRCSAPTSRGARRCCCGARPKAARSVVMSCSWAAATRHGAKRCTAATRSRRCIRLPMRCRRAAFGASSDASWPTGDAFPDAAYGFGWGWDDFDFGYSAGIDELQFNEGFFRVIVQPGHARRREGHGTHRAPLPSYPYAARVGHHARAGRHRAARTYVSARGGVGFGGRCAALCAAPCRWATVW
jgi:hypothetical protein